MCAIIPKIIHNRHLQRCKSVFATAANKTPGPSEKHITPHTGANSSPKLQLSATGQFIH